MAKYIFVTGGVFSSVGKGIAAGSIGKIIQQWGTSVAVQKLDPYINVDPGTLSPYQHGEVFVTHDGAEADLDLGHYERFLDINVTKACSVTAGQIYASVIEKERKGDYLGGTIQVIPHITQGIKCAIEHAAIDMKTDVLIVEVGGTVGDVESAPFLEAIRQMRFDYGDKNTFFVHLTWFPYLQATGELKTKPSQHSLRDLRSIGIIPDAVIVRSDHPIEKKLCNKLARFGSVPEKQVFSLQTELNPYRAPLALEEQGLGDFIMDRLELVKKKEKIDWNQWKEVIKQIEASFEDQITIALVGKYVELQDAYLSVKEALQHAAQHNKVRVNIKWVYSDKVTEHNIADILADCKGVVVPGGFGDRGVEGKIIAARWARKNNIPYLGLCLGLHVMCVDLAREFISKTANSLECDEQTEAPIVALMDQQKNVAKKGGTMRLGIYPCKLLSGSKAALAYGQEIVNERHRHRFEFNNEYRKQLEDAGMIVSGESPDGSLVEIVEMKDHPFMVASQFHPEFLSRPGKPHPLFNAFVASTL
jgi:CTP synthase